MAARRGRGRFDERSRMRGGSSRAAGGRRETSWLLRSVNRNVQRLASRLEADNVGEFVALSQRPMRMIWMNLLAGLSRGLGFFLGAGLMATLVTVVAAWVTYHMVPALGDLGASVLNFIRDFMGRYGPAR